jgi:hypothetical protein
MSNKVAIITDNTASQRTPKQYNITVTPRSII